MKLVRLIWRGGRLAVHAATGALEALLGPKLDERFIQRWSRKTCAIMNLRVKRTGVPAGGGTLYAANHISWIEVMAFGTTISTGFVAKEEVARWPLIGTMAEAVGTVFLRRGSARAASRAMTAAIERLSSGRSITVFPEGTSTSGESVLPFRASLFEAAIQFGGVVQPVSVYYPLNKEEKNLAPFVGDEGLVPHLMRLLMQPRVDIELAFLPVIHAQGRTRDELARQTREAVVDGIAELRRAHERARAK